MDDTRLDLIESILELEPALHRALGPMEPDLWLDVDLTMSQLKILLALSWAEEAQESASGLRMSDLAQRLGVTPATVTTLVDRLVERGLVERREDPLDRRQHRCRPSSAGLSILNRICEGARLRTRALLTNLSQTELETVRSSIALLIQAAQRLGSDRSPASTR